MFVGPASAANDNAGGTDRGLAIPVVDLTCQPGELDVNTASKQELMTALDIARPIAERLIAGRPHYSIWDALLAAGLGPERIELLAATVPTCATVDLPPAAPADVCVDPDQLDLQIADQAALTNAFSSAPAAERLIEWRHAHPLPSVDHALISAGISKGKVKKIYESLCISPAPFEAVDGDGNPVAYRWIYSVDGGSVEIDGVKGAFSLTVPADTITEPTGAWASVTELPEISSTSDWPRMDAHIDGSWSGAVDVTMPRDTFTWVGLGLPTTPAILHTTSAGTEMLTPDHGVSSTATSVSGPLTSLSTVETMETPWYNRFYDVIDWASGSAVSPPHCDPSAIGRVSINGGPVDPSLAGGPLFGACSEYRGGGSAAAVLKNRSTVIFRYMTSLANPPSSVSVSEHSGSDLIAEVFATGSYSAPDGEVHVSMDPAPAVVSSSYATWPSTYASLDFTVDQPRTAGAIAADVLMGEILDYLGDQFPAGSPAEELIDDELYEVVRCVWEISHSDLTAIGPAIASCVPEAYDAVIELIGDFSSGAAQTSLFKAADRWSESLAAVGDSINKYQDILRAGTVAYDLIGAFQLPNGLVSIDYSARKPTSYGSYPIGGHCLSVFDNTGWRLDLSCQAAYVDYLTDPGEPPATGATTDLGPGYLVREATSAEWFFNATDSTYHQLAPGVWACLATRYPVEDNGGIILGKVFGDEVTECDTGEYLFDTPGLGTLVKTATGAFFLLHGSTAEVVDQSDSFCANRYYSDVYREEVPGYIVSGFTLAPDPFICIHV